MLMSGLVFKLLDQLLLHLLGELTLAIERKSRIAEQGWAFTLALDTACSALFCSLYQLASHPAVSIATLPTSHKMFSLWIILDLFHSLPFILGRITQKTLPAWLPLGIVLFVYKKNNYKVFSVVYNINIIFALLLTNNFLFLIFIRS